jgi:hypothetical protein
MPENGIIPSPYVHGYSSCEPWRTRLGRVLLSRQVGALAGTVLLLIFLGCMSLSIGCKTEPDGTVCQEGKVSLHKGQELDVYYPAPYASPPNLELSGDCDKCDIIEQKADHFRIRCNDPCDATPHWQARGLRCPPPGTTPPVIVTPSAPPPAPPPTNDAPVPLPTPTPAQNP